MRDNEQQIDYWNGLAGETWVKAQQRLDSMLAPLSNVALAKAAAQSGERVIDVGCGCGTTSMGLAESGASVWGVDVSGIMLDWARKRSAGNDHLNFSETDASTQAYTPDHQLLFSRFGVMFFAEPVAAFTNLRTALEDGGRMTFLCWQSPRDNPWVSVGGAAIAPYLPETSEPMDPRAPGPFAFADKEYLQSILNDAGFSQVEIEDIRMPLHLADNLDEAMEFQSEVGPAARVLAELEGEKRDEALAAARSALAEHMTDDGLSLGAAVWLVSARNTA